MMRRTTRRTKMWSYHWRGRSNLPVQTARWSSQSNGGNGLSSIDANWNLLSCFPNNWYGETWQWRRGRRSIWKGWCMRSKIYNNWIKTIIKPGKNGGRREPYWMKSNDGKRHRRNGILPPSNGKHGTTMTMSPIGSPNSVNNSTCSVRNAKNGPSRSIDLTPKTCR